MLGRLQRSMGYEGTKLQQWSHPTTKTYAEPERGSVQIDMIGCQIWCDITLSLHSLLGQLYPKLNALGTSATLQTVPQKKPAATKCMNAAQAEQGSALLFEIQATKFGGNLWIHRASCFTKIGGNLWIHRAFCFRRLESVQSALS